MDEQHGDTEDVLAARRSKLKQLKDAEVDPFPHSFPNVESISSVRKEHELLEAGQETDSRHRIAGRIGARRGQGKMAFLDLVDRSGRLQLQARADLLGEQQHRQLLDLDLGDIVGIDGTIFCSKRGELSLRITDFTVLAKTLRPPPDKYHGLRDVETRLRQRELDLIANEDTRARFIARARIISLLRQLLDEDGFIEVETPVLQPLYGGALARPFTTHHNALNRTLYLRIATELYLKRCIVGGLEKVYELGKDFRNEGLSPKHNPEFTMVEWYEAYTDYEDQARRLEELVGAIAKTVDFEHDAISFNESWQRVTLVGSIEERTGINVLAFRDVKELAEMIHEQQLRIDVKDRTWPQLVDDLFSTYVEPTLIQPTFVFDYPVELSPFAKHHRQHDGLVERWEAYIGGVEVANAFTELNDPDEQRARFEAQERFAAAGDDEAQPYDESFVRALEHGMPPTGGVGLGVDRLVMILTGTKSLREVILFPTLRNDAAASPKADAPNKMNDARC